MKKPGQWWNKSWSIVSGCSWPDGERPTACDRCWAEGFVRRFPASRGPHAGCLPSEVRTHPERLDLPLRVRKPTTWGVPINLGDLFHPEASNEFIAASFGVMAARRHHTFVVVTKRWARAAEWHGWIQRQLPSSGSRGITRGVLWYLWQTTLVESVQPPVMSEANCRISWPLPNVIVMASAWDQSSADDAACHLAPLGIRWGLHLEPMLGPVVVGHPFGATPACWIACGAENGPGARPMHHGWACQLRDQCAVAGVPFWLKGLGRGKGRLLDGREHNEVPW